VLVNVFVYVFVYALGLMYPVPVRVSVVVGLRTLEIVPSENEVVAPLVGGERNEDMEIGPEPDEETELLVGDDGREL
jgi:hypothetical protein